MKLMFSKDALRQDWTLLQETMAGSFLLIGEALSDSSAVSRDGAKRRKLRLRVVGWRQIAT